MDACVASVSPVKSAPFGESRRGGLFATAPIRIALLLAAFAAALFPLVHDGVAGESERAPPPPVYVTCPDGECPAVVLCEPGSVWDARARTCRQISFCPGDRKVQIPGGPCELYCRPGTEANPFDPNRCRPVVSCPEGTTEKADGVCEIACPDGRQENPYAPGTCRPAFFCPDGQEEVAEGECAARCGAEEERDVGGDCHPTPPSAEFCARSGMAYDAMNNRCLSFPRYCPLIGKIHEPFANRCAANPEICQRHGLVYIAGDDECRPPADETCRAAGMFFHVNQCVSVDPASCPAMGRIYDSGNDRCAANPEICQRHGLVYIAGDDECRPPADETCRAAGMFFHVNQCVSVDPAGCPAMGRIYDSDNDQCAASPDICEAMGEVYIANEDRCRPPTDETCRAAGMFFHANQCVSVDPASCPAMELVYILKEDKCLASEQICREANMAFLNNRCVALTPEYCRQMGQFLDNNQCVANKVICEMNGLVYNPHDNRCVAISAASCDAAGQRYDPVGKKCVAICAAGTEPVDNACLNVCRNNDHNGRFHYDPQARPVFNLSNYGPIPPPVERTGGCVCPPGADGDACRELDRSHGTTTVKLPFAHSLTLANGEFLLGQGVTVGVMEVGPLQWRDPGDVDDGDTITAEIIPLGLRGRADAEPGVSLRTHSDLPSVKIFCATDEQGNELPCYDSSDEGIDAAFHGIAVLGVLAAKKDGKGLVGVAPEADYLYAWYNYHPLFVYQDLVTTGASIINNSWTPTFYLTAHDFNPCSLNRIDPPCEIRTAMNTITAQDNLRAYARQERVGLGGHNVTLNGFGIDLEVDELFTNYNHATSQKNVSPADRPIYVWSAGNNNGRRVTADLTVRAADGSVLTVFREGSRITATALAVLAGLPHYFPEMTLNNLAVAAVDEFYQRPQTVTVAGVTLYQSPIARFSNPCGEGASSFCLAAPGVASYEYGQAEYVEIARQYADCDLGFTNNRGYECGNSFRHEQIITRLAAQKLLTGLGSGFVLAPETEAFTQQERRLTMGYDETQGTSFSAPIVSGALALMKSYFMLGTDCGAGGECGLGSHELVGRILTTADRRGIYADASIYGSGLLDLKNALTPQGELRLLLGRSVTDSSSHLLAQSGLRPGAALGDSALRALSGVRLAAFDDLNAPFPVFGDAVLSADDSAERAGGGSSGGSGGSGGGVAGASVGISREEAFARVGLGF